VPLSGASQRQAEPVGDRERLEHVRHVLARHRALTVLARDQQVPQPALGHLESWKEHLIITSTRALYEGQNCVQFSVAFLTCETIGSESVFLIKIMACDAARIETLFFVPGTR